MYCWLCIMACCVSPKQRFELINVINHWHVVFIKWCLIFSIDAFTISRSIFFGLWINSNVTFRTLGAIGLYLFSVCYSFLAIQSFPFYEVIYSTMRERQSRFVNFIFMAPVIPSDFVALVWLCCLDVGFFLKICLFVYLFGTFSLGLSLIKFTSFFIMPFVLFWLFLNLHRMSLLLVLLRL